MTEAKSTASWFETTVVWTRRNPAAVFLGAAIIVTLIYFFGVVKIYLNGHLSTWTWAWQAWNPETNYEHAKLIPLIVAFLVWHSRDKLKVTPIGSSRWGWLFVGIGILLFIAGARTLQGRLALMALPFLFFGIVLYVWGQRVARILLFPIAFLFFMVPSIHSLIFANSSTTQLPVNDSTSGPHPQDQLGLEITTLLTPWWPIRFHQM